MNYATRQAGAIGLAAVLATGLYASSGWKTADAARSGPAIGKGAVVSGPAKVIDGDTIVIGSVRIRLEGIDAPETGQVCGKTLFDRWSCGQEATAHLNRLVANRTVDCIHLGDDRYGRMLGRCTTAGLDINSAMVRNGMAWAFVKYSRVYENEERSARDMRLGIWKTQSMPAWEYRAYRWSAAATGAPTGCAIKGNISRNGRLYHMPWHPWYSRTRIDLSKGERWFCSEAEAEAAGWRSASSS